MQSSGGVLPIADSAEHAAWTVLSGPAGGVIGAARLAADQGDRLALTFDMGGTSCDVALVRDGAPARTGATVIAGHPLHLPMLDVATVSAGGGSIAWADSGGALRVGPHSAGARPGPAAYGLGGEQPTVTDADVVLGRLPADQPLGGRIRLDAAAARAAVGRLAAELGLGLEDCAEGIVTVAVQEMVRALRLVSVERGEDPREATLIAFGGAGPLHACPVADELGIRRVLAPPAAGRARRPRPGDRRRAARLRPDACWPRSTTEPGLAGLLAPLRARAERELPGADQAAAADCRYAGQSHALTVPLGPGRARDARSRRPSTPPTASATATPTRAGPVEAVSLRLAAERPGSDPRICPASSGAPRRRPGRASPMEGATCWVGDGWTARADAGGAHACWSADA